MSKRSVQLLVSIALLSMCSGMPTAFATTPDPANGGRPRDFVFNTEPLPTLKSPIFPVIGVYDLGLYQGGSKRAWLRSGGERAWDTLRPCGTFVGREASHEFCVEPVSGRVQAPVSGGSAGASGVEYRPVDLGAIAGEAAAQASPGELVLHVQPGRGWVYTDVPTIAYLTGASEPSTVVVDGFSVTVDWRASRHEFDFADPSGADSTVVSSEMGAPYPDETISWVYRGAGVTSVSARSVWDAHISVGGVEFVLKGQRESVARSNDFEVRKPIFSLTKPPTS